MGRIAKKYFLISLGFFFVGLAFIGIALPGLPTVPFLIVALWCFSKSSERFHNWLYNHKIFGPSLKMWDEHRVIPYKAKVIAIISMSLSMLYLILFSDIKLFHILCVLAVMLYASYYILTKPSQIK